MKLNLLPLGAAVCLMLAGCNRNENTANVAGDKKSSTPGVTPTRQTSFHEVTSQLDSGGSVYGYLATDQWLANLATNVGKYRELIVNLPDVSADDRENVEKVFDFVTRGITASGLEKLTGVGVSGIEVEPGLHRVKFILHHRAGEGDGLLWNLFGKEAHALTGMDLLSTNVAVAGFGDIDLLALWQAIERGIGHANIPDVSESIRRWPQEFERGTKMSWSKLLESFGGEVGFALLLDDDNQLVLPLGPQGLEFPTPGLLLAVKVNDEMIFNRISEELKKNEMAELTDEPGLKMYAMPIPVPLPVELQITVASTGDYLLIASSPQIVRDAVAVRVGKIPGMRQSAEVQALLKYLPEQGNQFSYVSRRFSEILMMIQKQALNMNAELGGRQRELIEKLLFSQGPTFGLAINGHTSTGWQSVSVGNQDSTTAIVAMPVAGVAAIGASMVLPALAKAKAKAQSIQCVNNMKQIGLAARIWATDNDDQFPFHVSRSKGGSAESRQHGGDSYDRNAYLHFQVMSNELFTPKILVCPTDSKRQVAQNFVELQSWNVSYQLRTGDRVKQTNPTETLIYCPIHHHVGLTDGSVQMGKSGQ